MAVTREAINQERIDEANVVEELSAGAEKAAEIIEERDRALEQANQAIRQRDEHIEGLKSHDSDIHGVVSEGSAARSARLTRMQKALDALKRVGVVAVALLILGIGAAAWYLGPHSTESVQVATSEAPLAGFLTGSAA